MLIATITALTILLLGGNGDFEYLLLQDGDKIFKEVITDKDLQKKVINTLKPIRKSIQGHKSNIEGSFKAIEKMSVEYADQSEAMRKEFDLIMKELKAGEYDIIKGRLELAKILPDSVWDDLEVAVEGSFDDTKVQDIETTIQFNIDAMVEAINENIEDDARRKRVMADLEQFQTDLGLVTEELLRASPSSNPVFRDQAADKIALEKMYYSLNNSLTKALESGGQFYAKARSMSMKSEWDKMVPAYKSKAKGK